MKPRSTPMMITLILLTATSIIVQNMFLPSLSAMADEFSVSYAQANGLVAGFLVATAVLSFFLGPLSDYYGRRPIMLMGLAIFCLATIGCLFAESFLLFWIFRMIQAAVVVGLLLSRAILRDLFDDKGAAKKLAQLAMAMAIAPMLAPLLGGILQENYGWRANFWFFFCAGIAMFVLTWIDLGETRHKEFKSFRDQIATYPTLLMSRRFWGYTMTTSFSIGAFYAYLGSAPIIAEDLLGLSPSMIGLFLGLITFGFFFGNFASSKLSDRMSFPSLMIIGRGVSLLGTGLGLICVLLGFVSPLTVLGFAVFAGLGNGLTIPVGNAGIMSVNPKLSGSASGLSAVVLLLMSALCSWIAGWTASQYTVATTVPLVLVVVSALGLFFAVFTAWAERRAGDQRQ
ncbi:MAG: multidrug effflux MFS transporter [Pseudomonadota bacterium]